MVIRITTSGCVQAHRLLYIRSIHGYYIVLPIEQQFWNFTNLDVWKENVYIQTEEILLF